MHPGRHLQQQGPIGELRWSTTDAPTAHGGEEVGSRTTGHSPCLIDGIKGGAAGDDLVIFFRSTGSTASVRLFDEMMQTASQVPG